MLENAFLSVVPPERAAAMLYRDVTRAEEIAPALRITAQDCKQLGVMDVVVPEPKGGAHADPEEAARLLKRFILNELVRIQRLRPRTLINERYDKFRHMGRYSSRISVAISKERAQIEEYLSQRLDGLKSLLPSKEVEVPLPKKEEEPPA
jgi:acetyl-CoA carboxylase carboxyl transferase subunit alpha